MRPILIILASTLLAACSALPAELGEIATSIAPVEPTALIEKVEATAEVSEPTAAEQLPAVDVAFTVDCSQIDPARQPDCDAFIDRTAMLVYPRLMKLTGTTLAACYKEIVYTIIPNDTTALAGGYTTANAITYMETYSIDSVIPYDVHEMIHSFSWCSGGLDFHIFHGALMNAVYNQLDASQFSQYPTEQVTREELERVRAALATMPADEGRFDLCTGALADWVTIAHFQLGDDFVTRMYQSTINSAPSGQPSELAMAIWRATMPAVQSLVETIESGLGPLDLPECGF
jgi:hypothetical protein